MNVYCRTLRCTFAVAAFALSLCAASPGRAADDDELGSPAGTVAVPDGLLPNEVQDAMVLTLSNRGWEIKDKAEARVVGYLKKRSNEATVTLIYRASKIEVYCAGWEIDKNTGQHKKPEQPAGWLKNIRNDLTKNLSRIPVAK